MYLDNPADALYELSQVVIPKDRVREALTLPRDFALFADNRDDYRQPGATWSLGPIIVHRDSPTIDRSNAEVLEKDLERLTEMKVFKREDWDIIECNHWAVGWVRHVTFRAIDDDGLPSLVFRYLEAWFESLREDWPIADEEHHMKLQLEEFEESLKWEYARLTNDTAPDLWYEFIAADLAPDAEPNERDELWVDEKTAAKALKERGWLDEEEYG